jgi:beta-phosphoglucomutase family hydrolase
MGVRLLLPPRVQACLFDLDGVLTRTAALHAAAWKQTFDEFLADRREPQPPFDEVSDYDAYVDGRPREDGVRTFLAARGIVLPEGGEGGEGDPPGAATVRALADRKNDLVLRLLRERGVEAYPGSVRFLHAVRDAGLRRAVVSSSANCQAVLAAAGIEDFFQARIDGLTAAREHLAGKPHPDTFLAAARALGAEPSRCAVFEDAQAGVAAGRAGGFGCVVGVDRVGQADALRAHGADVVVPDLDRLLEAAP